MRRTTVFWFETVLAVVSALAFVLTLVWKAWVEILFRVDPDQGSGAAECWLAIASGVLAITFGVAARLQWRRRPAALSQTS